MSEHTHTYTHEHSHGHDGQEHSHEHTHTYTHNHEGGEKEHTHDSYEHDHEGAHNHQHKTPENKEQVKALLDYTYKHNTSHADELKKLSEKLKSLGNEDAAKKVDEAEEFFAKGNAALKEALDLL